MHNWPQQLAALGQAHRECVIVTVAGVRGSAPREVGSKMLVTESNQSGMIGGGYLENECTRQARELLGATDAPHRKLSRFALGSQCGQCCGGVVDILFERVATNAAWVGELAAHQAAGTACLLISHRRTGDIPIKHVLTAASMELPGLDRRDVTRLTRHHGQLMQRGAHVATLRAADGDARDVLIEPVDKAPLNLIIFGGGHVGRACTEVFATLDANITVVDSRHEYIDHAWPAAVTAMYAQQPEDFVALAPSQAYFLVMTHDHALDLRLCHAILARRDRAFCGLIGSRSKQRRFEKRLRAMGIDDATLATLTCPIGIPTIAGKQPGQIAIATAAQILEHAQAVTASNTAPLRLTAGGNPTRPQG